jgi:hypothetical protein
MNYLYFLIYREVGFTLVYRAALTPYPPWVSNGRDGKPSTYLRANKGFHLATGQQEPRKKERRDQGLG